ncbi:hypothetical protein LWI29_016884 [Acer saccharum]|uniref:Pentatricopeptide repeat-containing protein n=1 Tax=Acer saccharum TaxID=4024 RepID=A0AA39W8J4_ACESA|nr:hypothetical protein LWI29_016884 [Acer saccharum]
MAATLSMSPLVLATPTSTNLVNQHEPRTKNMSKDSPPIATLKNCKTLDEVKQLHCQVLKRGQNRDTSYVAKVISTCVEMGTFESLKYAQKAFDVFKNDSETSGTLFMYNFLIRGYSSVGLVEEAILLYLELVGFGLFPDKFTFPFVLSACAKSLACSEGAQVHGAIVKMGFEGDVFIANSLIHFYGECGEIDYGRKVFDEMSERNVVSWTSLICGCARRDKPKEAVDLFFHMVEEGVRPNSVTMVCVISACAKLQDLELSERVCAYIDESEMKVNTLMVNALVDMYMKCGAVDTVKRFLDECEDRDLVLCNTVMSNYVRLGLAREALSVLDKMLLHGPRPDRVTMLSAISASAQLGDLLCGRWCHGYVLRIGLEGWDSICNAMIDMYMKCGKQESACRIFDGMSNKTVVSWNSLIAGFVRNGDVESAWGIFEEMPEKDLVSWNTVLGAYMQESMFEEAIELFRVMEREGITADRVTMVAVASACAYLGALDVAKWIYTYIKKSEIHCDMQLETALVDMFARCGDPQSAMQVFNKMEKRDLPAWTAAIGAMATKGNGEQAVELFNKMLKQGMKPDAVVFVGVLTACSHGGLVEQGWQLFRSMKEVHGISPQIVHYGCMVDLLGRAGLLGEALDFIKSMPMEPNDVIWGSFLAACRTHKNVDMATYATERITEMSPEKTGRMNQCCRSEAEHGERGS